MVAAQAQTSPLSTASRFLESDDASTFLSGVAAVQSYNEHEAVRVGSYENEVAELAAQRVQLGDQVDKVASDVQRLRRIEAGLDAKVVRAKNLLDSLKKERRERVEARLAAAHAAAQDARQAEAAEAKRADSVQPPESDDQSAVASVVPEDDAPVSSGSGSAAVDFALGQVGDAYVYGAAGPSAWDCSGLTMQAWAAAGVSLPHSAAMQSSMGTAVSVADLQPGDLVFYYSPISHVGMYVGNGQLVHAPNPSTSVEVVPVDSMPIAAVRRVG
jgi:cell wall-associated NlpC family hydrolase